MKKLLGLGLALVMALSVMVIPTTALAADGDLLTLTIKGVKVNAPEKAAKTITWAVASPTASMTEVILSEADAADTTVSLASTFDGNEVLMDVKKISTTTTLIGNTFALSDLFDSASATTAYTTTGALVDGDILIASITTGAANTNSFYFFKVFVGDKTSNTIEGEGTIENVLLRVVLPVNLDFALNPLQIGESGDNQISTTDYPIVNKTKAPVEVQFALSATVTNSANIKFATDSSLVKPDDTSVTDKALFLALLGASGTSATASSAPITNITDFTSDQYFDYDSAADGTLIPMLSSPTDAVNDNPTATITFALDAADANGDLAANDKGVASFQFFGIMNTYAPWQASTDKVTVKGTYKLTPLRGATYEAYDTNNQFAAGGLNQLKSDVTVAAGMPGAADVKLTAGKTAQSPQDLGNFAKTAKTLGGTVIKGTNPVFWLPEKPATIEVKSDTGSDYSAGTNYTYTASTGLLEFTFLTNASNSARIIVITGTTPSVTYAIKVTNVN